MALNKDSSPRGKRFEGTPAWALATLLGGLVLVLLGERVLSGTAVARTILTSLGMVAVVGTTAMRWFGSTRTTGEKRKTERTLAALCTAAVLALLAYFTTAEPFVDWLGISGWSSAAQQRYQSAVTVTWIVVLLATTIPQIFVELALFPMREAEHVEWRRVRDALFAGVTLSLAIAYGSLFTYVADALDLRADFSYFRTSKPSDSTIKILDNLPDKVRIVGFFPPVNEVGTEVEGYLNDLARASERVQVEMHDRLLVPELAKQAKVSQDGTVVVMRGEQQETLQLGTELQAARAKLKRLDSDVQRTLLKLMRKPRTAYLTVGHGELNDTQPTADEPGRTARGVRELLQMQNYTVRDLGMVQGLGRDVPEDATLVLVLGPSEPFAPEEVEALKRYADRGGHVLMALEPQTKTNHAELAGLFGLQLRPDVVVCNERNHAVRRRNASDHSIIFSNRFSVHQSVSMLARLGSRPVFFLGASALDQVKGATDHFKIDFAITSLPDSFGDQNGNFTYDQGESKGNLHLVAAVSPSKAPPADENKAESNGPPEMRAVVVADVDALSDGALLNASMYNGNPQFVADVLRWLGGEESFSGTATTTEDVRIEHTKQKDRALFYGTIFGAPGLVLGAGLLITRRSRSGKKARSA